VVRGDEEVHLEPMVMDLLVYLASRPGQVVSKQEITDAVWEGRLIAEATLSKAVAELRRALGDDASSPRFVETIPKRGYRLLAAVGRGEQAGGELTPDPCWAAAESPVAVLETPCLAREPQLARLDELVSRARAGDGQVAFVVGEAGAGKTVLVRELVRRSTRLCDDLVAVEGRCNWYNGLGDPFLPFREVLRQLAGDFRAQVAAGAVSGECARRLWGLLPVSGEVLARFGPDLVGSLVSAEELAAIADSQGHGGADWVAALLRLARARAAVAAASMPLQSALLDQVGRVLQEVARHRPLLLVVEDLQWADQASLDTLLHVGLRLRGHRILIVGTFRPADVALGLDGARHPLEPVVNELESALGAVEVRVGEDEDRRFVEELLDQEPNRLGGAFRDRLVAQTRGHALFTVELVEALRARGMLARSEDGTWVEGVGLDWGVLPARVQGVVAERVGRLPEAQRELLKVGSVEGELFTAEVLARVLDREPARVVETLSEELERKHRLVEAVAVSHTTASRISTYRFRHLQFQAFAYSRVGPAERAYLHEAVGNALEALHGDRAEEISPQLARHFEAAGDTARAAAALLQAGARAGRLSAYREASEQFARALDLLPSLPPGGDRDATELRLRLANGRALSGFEGYYTARVGEQYVRARDLCRRVGDPLQLVQALIHLALFHNGRGENRTAVDLADQALVIAERCGAPLLVAAAKHFRLIVLFQMGDFVRAQADALEVVEAYDAAGELPESLTWPLDVRVAARAWLSYIPWFLGSPDLAVEWSGRARQLAERVGAGLFDAMVVELCSAACHRLRGDLPATRKGVDAVLDLPSLRSVPEAALAVLYSGWLESREGRAEQGISTIRGYLAQQEAIGFHPWRTKAHCMLAEACLRSGRADKGLAAARAGLAEAAETGEGYHLAELHRLEGELLLCQGGEGAQGEAEGRFQTALEVAREQRALGWELRAATSLARLWQSRGERERGRELLGAVYAAFTEGFTTGDLVAAKELLAELAPE